MKKQTLRKMQNQSAVSDMKQFSVADMKSIEDTSSSAVVADVKRLMEAVGNRAPVEDLVLVKLRKTIIKGDFFEVVAQECGMDSLVFVLKEAMKIKRKNETKKTKTSPASPKQFKNKNETDEFLWEQQTEQLRFKIRTSLTHQIIRDIYFKLKNESKKTTDYLRIESNTSPYAIEAVENGNTFSYYSAARLVYYLLTNGDINDSKYYYKPEEVFVDYLAGKKFPHIVKNTSKENRNVDNPKVCGLPIYLKK